MQPITTSSMFQAVGLFYGLGIPLFVLIAFIALMVPALLRANSKPEQAGRAVYALLAQMLGILLMTSGALPALYAVFARQYLASATYLGLIIVFGTGGLLYLWHDTKLKNIELQAKELPQMLFFLTWKFTGLVVAVFAGISFMLRFMLATGRAEDWWVTHLLMFLYGLTISWFTLDNPHRITISATQKRPVIVTPARKKVTAKKAVTKKNVVTRKKRKS